jgi:hypothetical protein
MPPDHPALSEEEVLAPSGWHPRYARVLAVASDGDYGFASWTAKATAPKALLYANDQGQLITGESPRLVRSGVPATAVTVPRRGSCASGSAGCLAGIPAIRATGD